MCTPKCARSPLSCAAGLFDLTKYRWSQLMNCPCPSGSSDCFFTSGWACICRRFSKARTLSSCTFSPEDALGHNVQLSGAHSLPIKQGTVGRPKVPRQLCRYTICTRKAVGSEQYCVLDCPHFGNLSATACRAFPEFSWCHQMLHVAQGPEVCLCICVGHY